MASAPGVAANAAPIRSHLRMPARCTRTHARAVRIRPKTRAAATRKGPQAEGLWLGPVGVVRFACAVHERGRTAPPSIPDSAAADRCADPARWTRRASGSATKASQSLRQSGVAAHPARRCSARQRKARAAACSVRSAICGHRSTGARASRASGLRRKGRFGLLRLRAHGGHGRGAWLGRQSR